MFKKNSFTQHMPIMSDQISREEILAIGARNVLMRELLMYDYTNDEVEEIPKEEFKRWMMLMLENNEKNNEEIKKIEETYVKDEHYEEFTDYGGEITNDVGCSTYSRIFETIVKVTSITNGPADIYIGWTHYYGGGKHADTYGLEYISTAIFLTGEIEKRICYKKFEE